MCCVAVCKIYVKKKEGDASKVLIFRSNDVNSFIHNKKKEKYAINNNKIKAILPRCFNLRQQAFLEDFADETRLSGTRVTKCLFETKPKHYEFCPCD